jgi:hypothetical protein
MLTQEENDLLTRVCGDAPMGQMLRTHVWIPALLSQSLVADGTPVRSRLLGDDFVAFRATDGSVGFFDEACPHRGVSLALARNEDNASPANASRFPHNPSITMASVKRSS